MAGRFRQGNQNVDMVEFEGGIKLMTKATDCVMVFVALASLFGFDGAILVTVLLVGMGTTGLF